MAELEFGDAGQALEPEALIGAVAAGRLDHRRFVRGAAAARCEAESGVGAQAGHLGQAGDR